MAKVEATRTRQQATPKESVQANPARTRAAAGTGTRAARAATSPAPAERARVVTTKPTATRRTAGGRSLVVAPAPATSSPGAEQPVRGAAIAADKAVDRNVTEVRLPVVGSVTLPPGDHLAWYAGVAALTALEILEWPVALALAVGKALSDNRTHRTVRALGDALEEAG